MLTPPITWFSTDNIPATSVKVRPDAEIELAKAPPGISLPTHLTVSYVVSPQGQITSCGDSAPSVNADLVAVACDPANLPKPMPMKNAAGNAVDVLYNWNVRFTLGTQ